MIPNIQTIIYLIVLIQNKSIIMKFNLPIFLIKYQMNKNNNSKKLLLNKKMKKYK